MLTTGQVIDRWETERVLGQGGTAVVYLVRHRTLPASPPAAPEPATDRVDPPKVVVGKNAALQVNSRPYDAHWQAGDESGKTYAAKMLPAGSYTVTVICDDASCAGEKSPALHVTIPLQEGERPLCWDFELRRVCR